MKKNSNAYLRRWKHRLLFILSFVMFIIACKKNMSTDLGGGSVKVLSKGSPDFAARLTAIKEKFYADKLDQKLLSNVDQSLTWTPDWEHPTSQIINDSVSYVFYRLIGRINKDGKLFQGRELGAASYLMVKNEKDFFKAFYYKPKTSEYKTTTELSMNKFTGKLLLTDLKNKQSFLLDYVDGRVSQSYQNKRLLAVNKSELIGPNRMSYWETQCKTVMKRCVWVSWGPTLTGGQLEYMYSEDCNWPPNAGSLIDSSEDTICENIWFPDPPTDPIDPGSSGEPGNNEPTQNVEVKDDSLKKHYPCMVSEVLDKLLANKTYRKLIQPFQSIQLPNGATVTAVQGLPNLTFDFSQQPYGGSSNDYKLGQTGQTVGYSSKIEFNSEAMNSASQLFLQMTAIHEVSHAYSRFYIKEGSWSNPVDTVKYSTWAMNIVSFDAAVNSQNLNGNFTDHSLFLENYFDNFWGILKQVNGASYSDKEYQMAALYGLNNPGTAPANPVVNGINVYNIYKDVLIKSYNNILTKYGITAAELNTFYLANLTNVPANKKLPTNCP